MSKQPFPIPHNESERLDALASFEILDTLPEADFDELTSLASEICQTPIALVSLIDQNRQWFKSSHGTDIKETPRELAFCAHTIASEQDVLMVTDAREDERFANNPLVTGDENVVFYAGVPLITNEGHAVGSLCVIGHEPKQLNEKQLSAMRTLARQVLTQMELRKKILTLQKANENLLEANTFIQKFAATAAHDIKNPLSSIMLTSQALQMRLNDNDDKSRKLVDIAINSTKKLMTMVDDMLKYSTEPASLLSDHQPAELNKLLKSVIDLLDVAHNVTISLPAAGYQVTCSLVALEQIFINLITNAVRYNDKPQGVIDIRFEEDAGHYRFEFADNGIGIAQSDLERIFKKNIILDVVDKFNRKGTGIGLYTVRSLVEKLGGSINARSVVGEGTTFSFSVKKVTGTKLKAV